MLVKVKCRYRTSARELVLFGERSNAAVGSGTRHAWPFPPERGHQFRCISSPASPASAMRCLLSKLLVLSRSRTFRWTLALITHRGIPHGGRFRADAGCFGRVARKARAPQSNSSTLKTANRASETPAAFLILSPEHSFRAFFPNGARSSE